jgi:multiple sugar transport system substrate-binding protein
VNYTTVPYENALGEQVRDFVAGGDLDIALIDLVWIGNFAENGWIVPIEDFTSNPELTDPNLDLDDFFPLLIDASVVERRHLRPALRQLLGPPVLQPLHARGGRLSTRPPATWQEVMDTYGPALTKDGQYA